MNIQSALRFVHRWKILLLLGPVMAGVAGYLVVREIPPVYEASATLLVDQSVGQGTAAAEDGRAEQVVRTFTEVIRTRPVLEAAAEKAGVVAPYSVLQTHVSARVLRETKLIRIGAEASDPETAAVLANSVAETFIARHEMSQTARYASSRESLARLVEQLRLDIQARSDQVEVLRLQAVTPARDAEIARLQGELTQLQSAYGGSLRSYEEVRILEARGTTSVTVVEPATPPERHVRPQRTQLVLLSVLAGLFVAAGFAIVADFLDDRLRDLERVNRSLRLPNLGIIPNIGGGSTPNSEDIQLRAESFRLLLANLQVATSDQQLDTIMVASANTEEGKSTTAASVARVLAENGQTVLLVDADLYRPSQHQIHGQSNRTGLSSLLANPRLSLLDVIESTSSPNLGLITSGPMPADPSALFASKRLEGRIEELRSLADVVVFDTPPILAKPDAALLGSHMDAVLFVVDSTKSRGRLAHRAIELLRASGAPVLGTVFNRVSERALRYIGYTPNYGQTPGLSLLEPPRGNASSKVDSGTAGAAASRQSESTSHADEPVSAAILSRPANP